MTTVWYEAGAAILNSIFSIGTIPLAVLSQRIQRTIAEQAVKILRPVCFMTRKEFTFRMLKKGVAALLRLLIKDILILAHYISPFR